MCFVVGGDRFCVFSRHLVSLTRKLLLIHNDGVARLIRLGVGGYVLQFSGMFHFDPWSGVLGFETPRTSDRSAYERSVGVRAIGRRAAHAECKAQKQHNIKV